VTDLVHLISELTGREALLDHTTSDSAGDLLGDNTQMRNVLGVVPATSLREGVGRTVASRLSTR
jgi:nucleoside-diphosphate-sugar epimerase